MTTEEIFRSYGLQPPSFWRGVFRIGNLDADMTRNNHLYEANVTKVWKQEWSRLGQAMWQSIRSFENNYEQKESQK